MRELDDERADREMRELEDERADREIRNLEDEQHQQTQSRGLRASMGRLAGSIGGLGKSKGSGAKT